MENMENVAKAIPEEAAGLVPAEEIAEAASKCSNKVVAGFAGGALAGALLMYTVPILVKKIKAHKKKSQTGVEEYDPEIVDTFNIVDDDSKE